MPKTSLKERMSNAKISEVTANSINMGMLSDELKKENIEITPSEELQVPAQPVADVAVKKSKGRTPKAEEDKRSKRVNFVVKPALYAQLEKVCEKTGRNMSNYVAEAVRRAIEQDLVD